VPPSGYSGRPQAAKLGLRAGQRIHLHHGPAGWDLAEPPDGLVEAGPDGPADLIIAFFSAAADFAADLGNLARRIYPAGALWIAWPRRAAGHRSDITDNVIREHALPIGLVDVKVAAIDEDWSGLRLVWRVQNRGGSLPSLSAGPSGRRGVASGLWVSLDAESPLFPP
jgi:hypothetical protein